MARHRVLMLLFHLVLFLFLVALIASLLLLPLCGISAHDWPSTEVCQYLTAPLSEDHWRQSDYE